MLIENVKSVKFQLETERVNSNYVRLTIRGSKEARFRIDRRHFRAINESGKNQDGTRAQKRRHSAVENRITKFNRQLTG